MGIAQIGDTNNRFNKIISNKMLFRLFSSLANAAFPFLNGSGVYYKQFDITENDWTPSGGMYWYEVAHYFDNKYPQIFGYKRTGKRQIRFQKIWYGSKRNAVVWVDSPVKCAIVVQADPGPYARGKRKFTDDLVVEFQ
jgi:hypothetical protein